MQKNAFDYKIDEMIKLKCKKRNRKISTRICSNYGNSIKSITTLQMIFQNKQLINKLKYTKNIVINFI